MADTQKRYVVSGTILQRGAKTLYRATRVADGRRVVLKVLDARLSRPQDLDRLRNEFQAGAALEPDTVARIIHRHGGEIRAEGAVGRGATFFFTLGGR